MCDMIDIFRPNLLIYSIDHTEHSIGFSSQDKSS